MKVLITSNMPVDCLMNPSEDLCQKQCFLKVGSSDYLHQITGAIPELQALTSGGQNS